MDLLHQKDIKLKSKEFTIAEANRYLNNGKETIAKSTIEYGAYTDPKYVSEGAGIAYLAALRAIDAFLISRGFPKNKLPKSVDGYFDAIHQKIPLNGKLSTALKIAYENLHVFAYYRGGTAVKMIKEGLENVKKIIEMMDKSI